MRLIERLLKAGARDAWAVPIVMKKGRPALKLGVLCAPGESGLILVGAPVSGVGDTVGPR